ncbi:Equilibrative nucleotide transporter 3 [Quillaja saponaria]|uniref:Equilibrative nucleotide transporter 3 n=1 Tax=Quillaja saponaria TaxID=32244 RepID=A0AAD7QH43_QUISA|nr:Equilibrative nucleotide transporter 3 [Quillaja saponaria]
MLTYFLITTRHGSLLLYISPLRLGHLAILKYNEAKPNTRRRNLFGYILFFLSSLIVIILDLATSGEGGLGIFIGICAISGAFGIADAHVQGGKVGDLSFMRPEFIHSFLAGLAASGAITSALRLITKAAFENSKDGLLKGAILFFSISSFFELLCVLLYAFAFPKLPIVKYYRSKAASEGSQTVSSDLAAGGIQALPRGAEEDPISLERLGNKKLLVQNIDYALDLFLTYVLTVSIFPGFLSEDTGKHSLGSWYALVLIAIYNVCDFIARYIPPTKCLNLESRKFLMIVILARFLLVPAFYFTAKYGDQGWMIMLTSFLGLSNGYLPVCVLTCAPKGYRVSQLRKNNKLRFLFLFFKVQVKGFQLFMSLWFLQGLEQNALGNLLVMFLLGGIFTGVAVALDWSWLIGKRLVSS